MSRVALTEILCVFCPEPVRAHVRDRLFDLHRGAVHTQLPTGWLIVEAALGEPRGRFLGGDGRVRFLLGEENIVHGEDGPLRLELLAQKVQESPAWLSTLPGDFSFVVLDSDGRVHAVRSCCGCPRLFGFCRDGVTAVSTRLDWLARVYPQELNFDRMRLAIELSGLALAPGCGSVIEGIQLVPCGHTASWTKWESPRVCRYWAPPERIEFHRVGEVAEAIEYELRAELRRHVAEQTNVAVLLSGGLDSSLLWAFAQQQTQRLDAVTTLPAAEHAAFRREWEYSRLSAVGCRQHVDFTLTPSNLVAHLRALAGDLCPLGMEWCGVGGLTQAPDVVVSGWFADECWGFLRLAECLAPWVPNVFRLGLHAPFKSELPRYWFNRHRSGRFTFPPANVAYPEVLDRRYGEAFKGWLANVSWVERPEQPAEKLRLHRKLTDMSGLYAEAASYWGARAVTPFTCRRLVELAAQCDPHLLFERGASKAPLRHVAKRLLPQALNQRRDKGDWAPVTEGVQVPQPDVRAVQALLDTQYVADHPFLSFDDVWSIEWLNVLNRGRLRVEHERKSIWR